MLTKLELHAIIIENNDKDIVPPLTGYDLHVILTQGLEHRGYKVEPVYNYYGDDKTMTFVVSVNKSQ